MSDKEKIRIELGNIGIIEGSYRRILECYTGDIFRQRKNFDEYYIDKTSIELPIDMRDLMLLAENFRVTVLSDCVCLSIQN